MRERGRGTGHSAPQVCANPLLIVRVRAMPPPQPPAIADALIHVQCAYTSLERWKQFGLLERERPWFARMVPRFGRVVLVTYGDAADHALAQNLAPPGYADRIVCIANERRLEPARFQAGVPERVAAVLGGGPERGSGAAGIGSAVVYTDQHFGGEVGIGITRALRGRGVRTGLVARGGYHWSWFAARDHGADASQATLAAAREGELTHAADVVVGSTQRMVDDLAWRHALPTDRCRVIPNFVDLPAPKHGHAPSAAREAGYVLAAGRLEPQKRFDLLIRAIAQVHKDHPNVRARIYGEGSQIAALRALISELRAPVEIRPRIAQTELLAEMRGCSVFAQTSAFEGHPKTIIEALGQGAPVVVTRGPGVDDEITPGVTGKVTGDDPQTIAAAIAGLLDDRTHAVRLGENAARDIRTRLSLDTIFPQVERACRDALTLNGVRATLPPGTVRWDQTLLNAEPAHAAQTFAGSIHAYAKRLTPEERDAFLDQLQSHLSGADPATMRSAPMG